VPALLIARACRPLVCGYRVARYNDSGRAVVDGAARHALHPNAAETSSNHFPARRQNRRPAPGRSLLWLDRPLLRWACGIAVEIVDGDRGRPTRETARYD
jgi:hypothetical protein